MNDQERIERLPKWARDEIQALRNQVKSLEADIVSISSDHQDSNVFIRDLPNMGRRGLPPRETIEFHLGADPTWHAVDVSITDQGRLQIMGHSSFHIYPRAANAIEIELGR